MSRFTDWLLSISHYIARIKPNASINNNDLD